MDANSIIEIAKQVGPIATAIGFFVWRDYKREERMGERIDAQSAYIQGTLVGLAERTITALNDFSACVRTRPCLLAEALEERGEK